MFLRHGLPGLLLALVCLSVPTLQVALATGLEKGLAAPGRYLTAALLIFAVLNAYAWFIDRDWTVAKLGWVAYLGALSLWEEWVFRLALPTALEGAGASFPVAAIISAVLFGAVHYFTLRWRLIWCVGAALGGLALSRQMQVHNDLLLISAFHWVATYLNTPRPPGQSRRLQPA